MIVAIVALLAGTVLVLVSLLFFGVTDNIKHLLLSIIGLFGMIIGYTSYLNEKLSDMEDKVEVLGSQKTKSRPFKTQYYLEIVNQNTIRIKTLKGNIYTCKPERIDSVLAVDNL